MLDVKTSPFSSSNWRYQSCDGRKSHLSKQLSFVQNQRLLYKLVDNHQSYQLLKCISITVDVERQGSLPSLALPSVIRRQALAGRILPLLFKNTFSLVFHYRCMQDISGGTHTNGLFIFIP